MLPYPQIDPVAVAIGPLQIHWYGLMYLVGIGGAWWLASRRLDRFDPTWTKEKLSDMIFWCAMGVIVGGRLGYVLFYDLPAYIANPLLIFEVWKGGMAFHGGFVGVMIATWWFARRNGKTMFQLLDFIAPLVPIGLGAGRIGNFINAELWGKPTDLPWAMVFPPFSDPAQLPRHPSQLYQFARRNGKTMFQLLDFIAPLVPIGLGAGRIGNFINAELWGKPTDLPWAMVFPPFSDPAQLPRHPSQLYQFALEGVALFVILWLFSRKPRPTMAVSGMFALFYGIFRFLVEFVRVPDAQLGYLAWGWLTMGQVLSLPMIIVGLTLLWLAYNRKPTAQHA